MFIAKKSFLTPNVQLFSGKLKLNFYFKKNGSKPLFCILLAILPFGWMTHKGVFGYLCLLLFILSVFELSLSKKNNYFFREKHSTLIFFSFSAIFLSTFFSQLLRDNFHIQAYDGPIRLILALPILISIFQLKINFSKVISFTLPLALIYIFLYALLIPNDFYGARLTNNYLDPIIWGNFSIILGFICFASINNDDKNLLKTYKFLGLALGITMSVLSQSRSGWLAGIFMAITWALINFRNFSARKIFLVLIIVSCTLFFFYLTLPIFRIRVDSTLIEVMSWINHTQPISSAGIRLTMWKISWYLFTLNPWIGYGEFSTLPVLNDPYISSFADADSIQTILCCGPHNEIASRVLQYGLFGLAGLMLTYSLPIYVFLKSNHHQSKVMGIILCVGMFISGLTGEMLSLKASYNFFAIFISGLLATTLWQNHEQK